MPRPVNRDDVLRRYPRLVSHLIAESLGYFCPEGAAGAILAVIQDRECACEWYMHQAGVGRRSLKDVGRETLRRAIQFRRHHRGFMAEYRRARALVDRLVRTGQGPVLGSWF